MTISVPAALRAVRATVVVPGAFALCYEMIGNLQMATFAAFGGFAALVLAAFGGTRREKALAHLGLAVAGSLLLVIGTAVTGSTALASLVTVPVVFAVLFAGVAGPNAASGATAALLAYVLPAASPGAVGMIPDRLAGWWLAQAASTLAVLVLSPRPAGDRLRSAAAASAEALAGQLSAGLRGEATPAHREATIGAKTALLDAFTATPYRPTTLAARDQALASLVALLEWCTSAICDSLRDVHDLHRAPAEERALFASTADTLGRIAAVLRGEPALPDVECLERRLADAIAAMSRLSRDDPGYGDAIHLSFHARTVGVATRTAAVDALVASRRAGPELINEQRRRWIGAREDTAPPRRLAGVLGASRVAGRHASLRSAWFVSSVRGAVALAAAVAVADLSGVQHGFWVVLGTLSVLRTNAAATGATAWRALAGTVVGFVVGGALILGIGTSSAALWAALPLAVLVASYAPGVLPFAAGQAAFTVVIAVLFNLLAPAGWRIGVVRVEDVAIGCAVSLLAGALFWPRGAGAVVGDDLAEAFRRGGGYLVDAVGWALGQRHERPDAAPVVAAATRLDDALRGFLAEQGSKRVPRDQLWRLVAGTLRLRLTAYSLSGLPNPTVDANPARLALSQRAAGIAQWYGRLATQVGRPATAGTAPLDPPLVEGPYPLDGVPAEHLSCTLWVGEHLRHLAAHLPELAEPAATVAAQRAGPWWR